MILLLLAVFIVCHSCQRTERFEIGKWKPKTWQLTPRTHYRSSESLKPPRGLGPDDYFRFIPTYIGTVLPGQPLTWTAPCFKTNKAELVIKGNVSATLSIATSDKNSLLCDDMYLLAYVASFDISTYEIALTHTTHWPGGWTDAQLFDLQTQGIRVFKFPDGLVASADEIMETVMLFFGGLIGAHVPEWTAEDNLKFLKDHMGVVMPVRPVDRVTIPKSQIKSGDFLGVIRLDGLDPMLAWGMGSHTGHTTIAMWIDNELYICESTAKSAYWPNDGIQMTLFDEWINMADNANYNVIHLPLSPAVAKRFDVQKAIAFFNSVKGLPYGFHNLFTGWVDTAEDNYPPPLTSNLVQLLAPFGHWLIATELGEGETYDFLAQGLNFRLGTKGLGITEAYMAAAKRGISFTELVTMPEQDSWIFQNNPGMRPGPSMVCDVFVMSMWKAGGIFGAITDQIQATEFTNWDAYTLNIFDGNYTRPDVCVQADPDSQFCQLLGKYRMALPQYNSFAPFPKMRENCPSLPPLYKKPLLC